MIRLTANRISGYSYDAAGNLLANGLGNTFTWDANEMISSSNGTNYYYDAEGERVGKSGSAPTDTVYFGGRPVARLAGGAWTDLIYGAGGLLAASKGPAKRFYAQQTISKPNGLMWLIPDASRSL